MQVTSKIKMDLTKPELSPYVNAVQGDSYSRSLEIALYAGVHPWTIPEDTTVAVRYAKPDRTGGYYDTLPDGTSAWHISRNTLTVQLAPQILTVSGNVKVQIELIQGTHILSTFCLTIRVEPNASIGVLKSENYVNWLQWIRDQSTAQITQIDQSVQAVQLISQTVTHAVDNALTTAANAAASASQAADAAASATAVHNETAAIAAEVSAIVAGNEAYTKQESDFRFCPFIVPTVSGSAITVKDSLNHPFRGLIIYGKTTLYSSPSTLVNAGENGDIVITVYGKNLCSGYKPGAYLSNSGIYAEANNYQCTEMIPVVPGAVYAYSNGISANISDIHYFSETREWLGKQTGNSPTFINDRPEGTAYIAINHYKADDLRWVQLELGPSSTEYESHTIPQEITVSTPNGLAGIPVASDGNYTDESGQQWLCDEIDFVRGICIQRVGRVNAYNGENIGSSFLSSTGMLSTGASVLYPLTYPVETPLSEEELIAFATLHSHNPSTTILNNICTGMKVSYSADTKLYIDNKLASGSASTQ